MKKRKGRLQKWLQKVPLRKKIGALVACIIVLMLASGATSLAVVIYSTRSMQNTLNNNYASYNLQQAVVEETRAFNALIRNRTFETEERLTEACGQTRRYLEAMPYDYEQTGEKRFEITWTIRNSYAQYAAQRDAVLAMNIEDTDYIREVYTTYSMQEYLEKYCANLTKTIFEEGNAAYETQSLYFVRIPYILVGVSLTALFLLLFILYSVAIAVFRTLNELAHASRKIENNEFDIPDISWESPDEVGQLVRAFNKMKHANKQYVLETERKSAMEERLHQKEIEKVELEKRYSAAQLQLIKSQLQPHFLFNTLSTIARMAQIEGAPTSKNITVAVSNLLRYNLRTTDHMVPLSQELKVVHDYMYIQQMRYGERVQYSIANGVDPLETSVPVFLLQPLVENAIIHGISKKEEGGKIFVSIRQRGKVLRIAVTDTGAGMPPERLEQVRAAMQREEAGVGVGIGLGNLCRRIQAFYESGSVNIYSKPGHGTAVLIDFGPAKKEEI
ncbi:MAG: histidine kinase [Oscillospiraceae bacterium]